MKRNWQNCQIKLRVAIISVHLAPILDKSILILVRFSVFCFQILVDKNRETYEKIVFTYLFTVLTIMGLLA